jgi:hypothetical protein
MSQMQSLFRRLVRLEGSAGATPGGEPMLIVMAGFADEGGDPYEIATSARTWRATTNGRATPTKRPRTSASA